MNERRTIRYRDLFKRGDIASIIGVGLLNAGSLVVLILLIREIVRGLEDISISGTPALAWQIALVAAVGGLYALGRSLEFSVPEAISFKIVHGLRSRLYDHMSGMAPRQIQHRSRGSLILRLTGDLTMLRTWLSRGISRGGIALASSMACLALIGTFSLLLAAVVAACFGIAVIASVPLGKQLQFRTARVRRRRSLLTSNLDEQVNALAVVQMGGRTRGEAARLERQSLALTDALATEAQVRGYLRGLTALAGWLAMSATLALGASGIASGTLDLGSVLATVVATRLLQGYTLTIGFAHDYWRRAEVSKQKLDDFLNSSSRSLYSKDLAKLNRNRARISFSAVTVPGALNEFTAEAPAGKHVAIVGPSGSGKSTLLQAMVQNIPTEDGAIFLGDQSLALCSIASITAKIGMVSPDLPLMRGSVRRNLTYRDQKATSADLEILLDRCGIRAMIEALPNGLDYWVTEGGANLSSGARQSIVLARAIFGNPPVLLLDQATALLSNENRESFLKTLANYAGTIIHVTSDLDDIASADLVWSLYAGRLASVETSRDYLDRVLHGATRMRSYQSAF